MKKIFPRLKKGQTHTLETIKERSEEEGDCWLWQAATSGKRPMLRHDGIAINVRTYIAKHLQKRNTSGRLVTMKCENLSCVNPDHIIILTRTQLQLRTVKRTNYASNPARRQRIAAASQRLSKLDWNKVREIRSMEGSSQGIARKLGLWFSTVHSIRNHRSWVEPSPFQGLFTGLSARQ